MHRYANLQDAAVLYAAVVATAAAPLPPQPTATNVCPSSVHQTKLHL